MKYIYLLLLALLLNNCTVPTINPINKNNKRLSINYKNNFCYIQEGKEIYNNIIYLNNMTIYQYIYKYKKNSYVNYEYIKAMNGYRFTKGIKRTVGIIFGTNAYILDYIKGNLYFFRLDLQNGITYLILENINSSAYKLVYGLSKESYSSIIYKLKENCMVSLGSSKNLDVPSSLNNEKVTSIIKTQWTPKLIIIDKIVSKPYRGK